MMRAALLGLAVYCSAPAVAEMPPPVDAALAAMEMRAEPGQRWSFVRLMTTEGESFTAEFDPSRPSGEMWRLIEPESEDDLSDATRRTFRGMRDDEDADLETVLGAKLEDERPSLRQQLGDALLLTSEDAMRAVFSFAPSAAMVGPDDGGDPPGFLEHLSGELVVDKAALLISSWRVFATESFKPLPVARIDEMTIVTSYAEVEPGGPIAAVSVDLEVSGNAMFRKVEQAILMENSDFARVDVP